MEYKIIHRETLVGEFTVEADSPGAAIEEYRCLVNDGEIDFSDMDISDSSDMVYGFRDPYLNEKKILLNLTERLPHEPGKIWAYDNDEILCKDEQTAEAIADLIDALYGEQVANTGYYDPAEDERNGEHDCRTGYYYVN